MSDEKVLTTEIAEQFLEDEYSVDLSEFKAIEDDAEDVIAKHEGSPAGFSDFHWHALGGGVNVIEIRRGKYIFAEKK